jgi:hypothetical protein
MHDAILVSKPRWHALSRELLQCDEPIGVRERAQCRLRIAIDVVVDIGSAQAHDQRPVGVKLAKDADAVCTAPRVKRNHQICGDSVVAIGDVDAMPELAQDSRPAHARRRVAGS